MTQGGVAALSRVQQCRPEEGVGECLPDESVGAERGPGRLAPGFSLEHRTPSLGPVQWSPRQSLETFCLSCFILCVVAFTPVSSSLRAVDCLLPYLSVTSPGVQQMLAGTEWAVPRTAFKGRDSAEYLPGLERVTHLPKSDTRGPRRTLL